MNSREKALTDKCEMLQERLDECVVSLELEKAKMSKDPSIRTDRLEMRLYAEERAALERAASLVGADTVGAWVRTLAVREARKVLRENGEKH
jgi:hypothetical protein